MSDIAGPASEEGNKDQPAWEAVTGGVDRLPIPGGWIYRTDRGVVFVPQGPGNFPHGYRGSRLARDACTTLGKIGQKREM